MTDKLCAIGLSLLILGQAYLLRRYIGTWIFPACIFGLFWFGFTFFPLVLQFSAPVEPLAVAYILAASLAFSGTALVFRWKETYRAHETVCLAAAYRGRFLRSVFYGMSLVATIATVTNWTLQSVSLHEIALNFFETGNEYLKRKYGGEISSNFASKTSVALTYPVAILGGIIFSGRGYLCGGLSVVGASFVAPVLAMAVEGNKGGFLSGRGTFLGRQPDRKNRPRGKQYPDEKRSNRSCYGDCCPGASADQCLLDTND